MSVQSTVFHEVGRDAFSNSAFHFILLLLPPSLSPFSSPCRCQLLPCLGQSAFLPLLNFPIICISVWWACSTCPLVWGWYCEVLIFWMPMSSHSSMMMFLSKLAPRTLRSLANALKIKMYPCHKYLATVFAV